MKQIHLFEVLGKKVHDSEGVYVGCLEDIEVRRLDESCSILSYHVLHRGLMSRIAAWAMADSLRRSLAVKEKSLPYRVPWDFMDLSDPEHLRLTVPQNKLERVRSD